MKKINSIPLTISESGENLFLQIPDKDDYQHKLTELIMSGIDSGRHVVLITSELSEEWLKKLSEDNNFNLNTYIENGSIILIHYKTVFYSGNEFDPEAFMESINSVNNKSVKLGFNGVLLINEIDWIFYEISEKEIRDLISAEDDFIKSNNLISVSICREEPPEFFNELMKYNEDEKIPSDNIADDSNSGNGKESQNNTESADKNIIENDIENLMAGLALDSDEYADSDTAKTLDKKEKIETLFEESEDINSAEPELEIYPMPDNSASSDCINKILMAEDFITQISFAVEFSHDWFVLIDSNKNILYFNSGAERISGHNSREILGASFEILFNDADEEKAIYQRLWDITGEGKIFRKKITLQNKAGFPFYLDHTLVPVKYNDLDFYISTGKDVTK
ncbi:MAG: PAS domain S-box protein, partial [Actinomycetia bacterium]|nr:PAS domain S-box protein [Actinomycetes bacterium]